MKSSMILLRSKRCIEGKISYKKYGGVLIGSLYVYVLTESKFVVLNVEGSLWKQ